MNIEKLIDILKTQRSAFKSWIAADEFWIRELRKELEKQDNSPNRGKRDIGPGVNKKDTDPESP